MCGTAFYPPRGLHVERSFTDNISTSIAEPPCIVRTHKTHKLPAAMIPQRAQQAEHNPCRSIISCACVGTCVRAYRFLFYREPMQPRRACLSKPLQPEISRIICQRNNNTNEMQIHVSGDELQTSGPALTGVKFPRTLACACKYLTSRTA